MDFQTLYQRLINCSEDQITEEVKKLVTDDEVDAIIKSKEFSSFYRCNVTEISLLTLYGISGAYLKKITDKSLRIIKDLLPPFRRYVKTPLCVKVFNIVNYEFYRRSALEMPNENLVVCDRRNNTLVVKKCIYYKKFAQLLGYSLKVSPVVLRYMENLYMEVGIKDFGAKTNLNNEEIVEICKNELDKYTHHKTKNDVNYTDRYYSIESCLTFINKHLVNIESDKNAKPYTTLDLDFITPTEFTFLLYDDDIIDTRSRHFKAMVSVKKHFIHGYHRRYETNVVTVCEKDIYQPQYLDIKNLTDDSSYDFRPVSMIERDSALRYFCLRKGSTVVTPELVEKFEQRRNRYRQIVENK